VENEYPHRVAGAGQSTASTRRRRGRGVRAVLAGACALGIVGIAAPEASTAPTGPRIVLRATARHVDVFHFGEDGPVDLSRVGVWVDAPGRPFEVRVQREYGDPFTMSLIDRTLHRTIVTALPGTLSGDFSGLADFFSVTIWRLDGRIAHRGTADFCPNWFETARTNPTGPSEPTYPYGCINSTWTKGTVMGIDRGWSVPALKPFGFEGEGVEEPLTLENGRYRLRLAIREPWRDALGLPVESSTRIIGITVRESDFGECPPFCDFATDGQQAQLRTTFSTSDHTAPSGRAAYSGPAPVTLPDLVPTPAWSMNTSREEGRDYLNFAADVWNAGPGPLVVEGFRRPNEAVMDAHQFFYRDGEAVRSELVGEFRYHPRGGHDHWHFQDFARYVLTDASKVNVQRSGKMAFCLAPTDLIDTTVPNADLRLIQTGFTQCGGKEARWIREVLQTGWGDTYTQFKQGQAFDITDLPNGTYFVKVVANPDHNLIEGDFANNVSYRRVRLGGVPGRRTVTVPPYRGMDTETGDGDPFFALNTGTS